MPQPAWNNSKSCSNRPWRKYACLLTGRGSVPEKPDPPCIDNQNDDRNIFAQSPDIYTIFNARTLCFILLEW